VIVTAIAAIGAGGVMGREGKLPWHLPRDLKRFRAITWGKPIIMGRKTHESLGRALPGRTNLVLTRQPDYEASGCRIARSTEAAVELARSTGASEAVVIGGSRVFEQFLPLCSRIHLTRVQGRFPGDVFFPLEPLGSPEWERVHEESDPADAANRWATRYEIYERRRGEDAPARKFEPPAEFVQY
jgi:dihydrofolate reductase